MAAGDAVVGALRIVLGLDTATFEDGAKRAAKQISVMGDVFKGVGLERIVERTFDAIAHALKKTIVDAFNFADEMGKMAQKVGVSVEELTGLKLAADLSDVSMESLSVSLGKLNKNIVGAAEGNQKLRDEFKKLGIDVRNTDGSLKSGIDVLVEMSDKFAGAADGSAKVATALELLGKGGKDLIPLLNQGSGELSKFREIAKNMGLIIETDTAKRVETFNDNMKLLSLSLQGVANLVVKDVIPIFVNLSNQWVETAKKGDGIQTAAGKISSAIKETILTILIAVEVYKEFDKIANNNTRTQEESADAFNKFVKDSLGPWIESYKKAIDAVNEFGLRVTGNKAALEGVSTAIKNAETDFDGMGTAANATAVAMLALAVEANTFTGRISGAIDRAREFFKALQQIKEEADKTKQQTQTVVNPKIGEELDKLALQIRVLRGDFIALPEGLPELAARLDLTAKSGANLATSFANLDPVQKAFAQRLVEIQAIQLAQEFEDPAAKFDRQRVALEALIPVYEKLGLNTDLLRQKTQQNALAMQAAYAEVAKTMVGNLASAFKDLASMNKRFAGVAKAAAIGEALINTYLAANKVYASLASFGPVVAAAGAATAVAAGLANVAKISATEFAKGGSFRVPGGVSGVDTTMIPLKLAAGERVDVTPAAEARRQGSVPQEIAIRLPSLDSILVGDTLRSLFETLNQGMADGYRLKVVT